MSAEVFGPAYAAVYDALYRDKDYSGECDLMERLFAQYAAAPVHSILDLGCGSGNHVVPFVERGFRVTGVDRSPGMLRQARAKCPGASFVHADIRTCRLYQQFDAVLMMFAVLGYQTETADTLAALKTARAHLVPGGLFLFDYWHAPAVLAQLPSDRMKKAGALTRKASSELDVFRQTCLVRFEVSQGAAEPFSETHSVRFFFPDEIRSLLGEAGFRMLRLGGFPNVEKDPDPSTWNVIAAAVAQ